MGRKLIISILLMGILTALILFGVPALYRVPKGALRFNTTYQLVNPRGTIDSVKPGWYENGVLNTSYVSGVYTLTLTLDFVPSKEIIAQEYYLVFPYIDGTALRVFWNNQYLGSQGDMERGNSNIWYSAKLFTLPSFFLQTHNLLRLEIQGIYEAGIPFEPYLISKKGNAVRILILQFISNWSILFLAGSIFIMGCTLLLIGSSALPTIDFRILLGTASILTALFLTDFMTLTDLPVALVDFKRWVVILRHGASLFFLFGFLSLLEKKHDWFYRTYFVLQILSMVALLFPQNMIDLKNLYTFTYIVIAPLPLYLLYQMIRIDYFRNAHLLILGGVVVGSAVAIRDAFIPLLYPNSVYLSHFGFMVIILASTGFVVLDVIYHFHLLLLERMRSERYREESIRDSLTGAFNRTMLDLVRSDLPSEFSLIMLDLNDFKSINDAYGHLTGDTVLKEVVRIMGTVFRRNDIIIRTGGDEFLVVLPNCPKQKALSLIEQLQRSIEQAPVKTPDHRDLRYSVSAGVSSYAGDTVVSPFTFSELLSMADQAMYQQKRNVKTRNL